MSSPAAGSLRRLLLAEWPYVVLYVAVIIGVGLTNLAPGTALLYWQVLIPLFGALALWVGWDGFESDSGARTAFVVRTLAHWAALFVLVRLLYLPQLQAVFDNAVMGLMMVLLLGFSALLAGIYGHLRMAGVGGVLMLSAVAIAFLDDAAVAVAVLAVVVAIVVTLVWQRHRLEVGTGEMEHA
ncbi:hypothetical protein MARPU_03145 [Marichromatium purpuratum 984]|uniref:Uncharacterized protein n=1 Tax=Marichromatium purpuratum 984 TaxID=765910 RepID=W0E179_MARPU|nr:hypothetical protein [Marichromatium purpuratum]AHF02979.1 hypothetical protein MARPU_03145 [Marichromatium purpuratum 984]